MMGVSYASLSLYFSKVKDLSPSMVGELIGGKVQENIKMGIFKNACAIRLSYAFNYAGIPINKYDGKVSSGKDKKWYLYRVEDMKSFVKKNIKGTPIKGHSLKDFKGKKGIIIFTDCNWADATGHIDLFNGEKVESHDYFGTCGTAMLYVLK